VFVDKPASLTSTIKTTFLPLHGSLENQPTCKFTLAGYEASFRNEVGVFVVDDDQGTIDGIPTGASGYLQAALNRAKPFFRLFQAAYLMAYRKLVN
jgi:hypothetical protein